MVTGPHNTLLTTLLRNPTLRSIQYSLVAGKVPGASIKAAVSAVVRVGKLQKRWSVLKEAAEDDEHTLM